jgi:hypothetical protein
MTTIQETQQSLAQRSRDAHAASRDFDYEQSGSLATFWRQATPGTAYWRGFVPMQALPGQVLPLEPDSLGLKDVPGTDAQLLVLHKHEGTAIWQFLGDDSRSRIALQLRRQGVRTLMEVDDLYLRFAPPLYGKHGAWTRTHAEAVANGTGYSVELHRKIVPQMDGIICATAYLADQYERLNPNVYHCPNSIDPSDWNVERVESDVLRIGYYGSPSHVRDFPVVKKALKWAARQKDVEVVMAGFAPAGWAGQVLPWADDLFEARKNLGRIDVGIAPLTRNEWSDGKSDLKALEYAMAGAMPIVEDSPPYSPWVASGWGWCPSGESEWGDAIREVVRERDKVAGWAAEAKDYVLRERTIEKSIGAWREAVSG